MSSCEFNVADVRQHRRGIHMPEVRWEPNPETRAPSVVLGELVMFGRSIPVINPEQLMSRLTEIGLREDVREEIVGQLFGYAVSSEAPVSIGVFADGLV